VPRAASAAPLPDARVTRTRKEAATIALDTAVVEGRTTMRTRIPLRAAVCLLAVLATAAVHAHSPSRPYDIRSIALARRLVLPDTPGPAAPDVAELRFADFHRTPSGPLGLEFTDRLRSLDGHRVRIVGYVVGQDTPSPGRFILAPFPVTLATAADGPADDLPPAHVYVALPPSHAAVDLPPVPVPVVVQGILHLGPQPEADSRVSWVRIELDPNDERLRAPDADAEAAPVVATVNSSDPRGTSPPR
jgi:hypothetical protein